jgi:hypothetical protein
MRKSSAGSLAIPRPFGRQPRCRKPHCERIVAPRTNTCVGVKTAGRSAPHLANAVALHVEIRGQLAWGTIGRTSQSAGLVPCRCAKLNVQTNTWRARRERTTVRFISPSVGRMTSAPVPHRQTCELMQHRAKCSHSHHCGLRCLIWGRTDLQRAASRPADVRFGRRACARRLHFGLSPKRRSTVGRSPGRGSERGRPSSRARNHLMRWRRLNGVVKRRPHCGPGTAARRRLRRRAGCHRC